MTRSSVIVSVWLLLTGALGDELLAGDRPVLRLLVIYGFVTALTAFALWIELADDGPRTGARRRRVRFEYD